MREIKFRALVEYPNGEKEWLFYTSKTGKIISDLYVSEKVRRVIIDDLQFTGLKDKNGKEIYEGDIFQVINGTNMMQGEIYFEDGSFRMKYGYQCPGERREDYFLSIAIGEDSSRLDVIGNKFENPELLK